MVVAALESGGRAPGVWARGMVNFLFEATAQQCPLSPLTFLVFRRLDWRRSSLLSRRLHTSAYIISYLDQIPTRCQPLDLAGFLHPSSRSDPSAVSSTSLAYRRSLSTQSSALDSKPTAVTPSVFKPSSSSLSE